MRGTSQTARRTLAYALGVAIFVAGCSGGSHRGTEGSGASPSTGKGTTVSASSSDWTRVPVKRVDLKPEGGSYVLEAQASVPSSGWKVEIRPLPVTSPSAREFEVVGLAPVTAKGSPTLVSASLVVSLDAKVEQIAVYDEDDATLLSPP
jgi:hypothetical protein